VESAFPDRFVRDADGTLIEIDDRWVNLEHEQVDDVKWGLNAWIPLGESQPKAMANRIEFSLFDTWYLHDVTLIRPGIPELNLLDGAPSDVTGGQPRHKIEFHTLYHRDGVGVLLAVAWRSPTVVGSGDPAAPDPIYFSSLGTADLRVFLDLGRLPWTRSAAWAQGARASLAVTNLFDRRQTVHDADGATPTAFEPGFLDPLGRVLALTIRKVF
jgi:outer membrane receptor protein involved in Fe transport